MAHLVFLDVFIVDLPWRVPDHFVDVTAMPDRVVPLGIRHYRSAFLTVCQLVVAHCKPNDNIYEDS